MAARRATEFGGRTKTSTNLRESLAGSVILDDDEDDGDGDDEAMHVNSNFGSASEARRYYILIAYKKSFVSLGHHFVFTL